MRRLDSLLLAGVGVLVVHQVAYTVSAIFGIENSVAHGHLAVAWFGGSLALLGVLARSVTKSLKRRQHDPGNVTHLALAISAGYFAMEQLERLADGYGVAELFGEPVFWLGLAVAPLVALALHWSVRTVAEIATFFLNTPTITWGAASLQPVPVRVAPSPVPAQLATVVSRRGPPVR